MYMSAYMHHNRKIKGTESQIKESPLKNIWTLNKEAREAQKQELSEKEGQTLN